ncbi:MAG: VTT domain-containing protein [Propionibacteriaceae bacterium]|jgi:membrane-associated protein|nr:VTT domain-containing protein [Propionibacteriaceae bacterium]
MTFAALLPLLLPSWLDPEVIITSLGNWALWGVALIIFVECAIFPVLPGDSLLFAVGMFTAMGTITVGGLWSTIIVVYVVLLIAAVGGNVAGYWVGRLIGPPLFKERTGFWGKVFDPRHVEKTRHFFEKYGARALILARFVPLVRTFVTLIAGVSKMSFRQFISYTAIGGVAWVLIVTTAGYFLGGVPIIKDNFELACIIIVLISVLPMVWEWYKARRSRRTISAD